MSRRRAAIKREVLPDPKYGNITISRMVNCLMSCGKKSIAETILYGALSQLQKRVQIDAIEAFMEVLANVKPVIEVRSRRVGGATYQVPVEVRGERAQALALRWLIASARKRSEKSMVSRLGAELHDAFNKKGASVKRKEDTHKMAEANRAFAHFRW